MQKKPRRRGAWSACSQDVWSLGTPVALLGGRQLIESNELNSSFVPHSLSNTCMLLYVMWHIILAHLGLITWKQQSNMPFGLYQISSPRLRSQKNPVVFAVRAMLYQAPMSSSILLCRQRSRNMQHRCKLTGVRTGPESSSGVLGRLTFIRRGLPRMRHTNA